MNKQYMSTYCVRIHYKSGQIRDCLVHATSDCTAIACVMRRKHIQEASAREDTIESVRAFITFGA